MARLLRLAPRTPRPPRSRWLARHQPPVPRPPVAVLPPLRPPGLLRRPPPLARQGRRRPLRPAVPAECARQAASLRPLAVRRGPRPPRSRHGCRWASLLTWPPVERFALHGRWPATVDCLAR